MVMGIKVSAKLCCNVWLITHFSLCTPLNWHEATVLSLFRFFILPCAAVTVTQLPSDDFHDNTLPPSALTEGLWEDLPLKYGLSSISYVQI